MKKIFPWNKKYTNHEKGMLIATSSSFALMLIWALYAMSMPLCSCTSYKDIFLGFVVISTIILIANLCFGSYLIIKGNKKWKLR